MPHPTLYPAVDSGGVEINQTIDPTSWPTRLMDGIVSVTTGHPSVVAAVLVAIAIAALSKKLWNTRLTYGLLCGGIGVALFMILKAAA